MKLLKKTWVRILISLLASGAISEVMRILYGIEELPSLLFFLLTLVIFLILSGVVLADKYRHYYFPIKNDPEKLEDNELLSGFNKENNTK